jgi:hypothetical protein
MPWQVALVLVILGGLVLLVALMFAVSWWFDITLGGTLDDLRDLRGRYVAWRTRRNLLR